MRPLSDTDVVRVWEYGCRASPARRAVALIAAAGDEGDDTRLTGLTPGERDARLLSVRRTTFGRMLDCVAACPSCGEQLEFTVDAMSLLPDGNADYSADTRPATLVESDYRVIVRPPTIGDLDQTGLPNAETLLDRCVVHAEHEGRTIATSELPASVVEAIDEHLGVADPAAIIELSMSCPACTHSWKQLLDIAAFLWTEISARAERLLSEVHALARAYGWSEPTILELGPARRARYLELVRG
ncbi:MAG: phage baseplate protein [Gemmatimonadales bacterium]